MKIILIKEVNLSEYLNLYNISYHKIVQVSNINNYVHTKFYTHVFIEIKDFMLLLLVQKTYRTV